jgi:lysophospholipase
MTGMERGSFELLSLDGTKITGDVVYPRRCRASVVICHGVGEHRGRYEQVREALAGAGVGSVGFDLRGHGESSGLPGHVGRFEEYLEDLACVLRRVDDEYRGARLSGPLFVMGHSLGGVIVVRYVQVRGTGERIAGLVLSSPAFVPALEIPLCKRALGTLLTPILPRLRLPTNIHGSDLTTDEAAQRAFAEDARISRRISLRWYEQYVKNGQLALAESAKLHVPTYAICGKDDPIAAPSAVAHFMEQLGSSDRQLRQWEGLRHELLHEREPERTQVIESVIAWIAARL